MRQEAIQMVKDQVTMQSLCQHLNIPVSRSGFACCPFHQGDKNGSLKVYTDPARGWHCFGCGEGGDVITFARKWYSLSFQATVERLASEFGIPIPTRRLTQTEKDENDRKRRDRERERWREQMRHAQIERDYWDAYDAYNANEVIIESADPSAEYIVTEDFWLALSKRAELKYNLEQAEVRRRLLYEKPGCHRANASAR